MYLLLSSIITLVNVPSSIKHHYSGTIYSTLSDTLLPCHHLNLPSGPIFSPLDSECVCVCDCVCVSVCVGGRLSVGVFDRVCVGGRVWVWGCIWLCVGVLCVGVCMCVCGGGGGGGGGGDRVCVCVIVCVGVWLCVCVCVSACWMWWERCWVKCCSVFM